MCSSDLLDVLARLGATDTVVAEMLARVLAANHQQLVQTAEAMARGTPDRPGHFTLAAELQRLLGGRLTERVERMLSGNTTYARDLSISYERLGDLAVQSGQGEQAQALYRQGLTIRERLAQAEPGNTTYARDLSISYERLGATARDAEETAEAATWFTRAAGIRRSLHRREPYRVDLAEELGVGLWLLTDVLDGTMVEQLKGEVLTVLVPFEEAGAITPKGTAVLRWARE